jgi:hypothetical protein
MSLFILLACDKGCNKPVLRVFRRVNYKPQGGESESQKASDRKRPEIRRTPQGQQTRQKIEPSEDTSFGVLCWDGEETKNRTGKGQGEMIERWDIQGE